MRGFGSNKQSLKGKNNIFEKDRLITYALEMHQKGNIQGAKSCYQKILILQSRVWFRGFVLSNAKFNKMSWYKTNIKNSWEIAKK